MAASTSAERRSALHRYICSFVVVRSGVDPSARVGPCRTARDFLVLVAAGCAEPG